MKNTLKCFIHTSHHYGFRSSKYFHLVYSADIYSNWMMRQIERQMLPLCNFYWFRIKTKHMTEDLIGSSANGLGIQECSFIYKVLSYVSYSKDRLSILILNLRSIKNNFTNSQNSDPRPFIHHCEKTQFQKANLFCNLV